MTNTWKRVNSTWLELWAIGRRDVEPIRLHKSNSCLNVSSPARKAVYLSIILCVLGLSASPAHTQQPPEQGRVRVVRYNTYYEIHTDGTAVVITEVALSPQNQSAIAQVAQLVRPYQESSSDFEFLEAYTLKQDGRRIDVAPDRILTQTPPALMQAPVFSDMKVKQAIFPDVSMGDQVVYRTRLSIRKPTFPGNFSSLEVFSRNMVYDSSQVRVKYPMSYPLHFYAKDMVEGASGSEGDFFLREWTYSREEAEPEVPGEAQTLSRTPHLIITSFNEWKDVAQAYQSRAEDKAAVTPEIRKLAEKLTKGIATPHDQASALYRWVSENIRYVAVYLSAGGYVPHDAESVLRNRYGDCKDHVTLLEALLAAKGIESSPALINLQPAYELPEAALPSAFNHVITWIPSLGLHVDSTAQILPFGVLLGQAHGKPVLHTRNFTNISFVPALTPEANVLRNHVALAATDAGKATVKYSMTGEGAMIPLVVTLARATDNPQVKANAVRMVLTREGFTGSGDFTHDASQLFSKDYTLSGDINLDNWINVPGPGAVRVPSGLFSALPLSAYALATLNYPMGKTNRPCGALSLDEDTILQFPPAIKLDTLPPDQTFMNDIASYESRYVLDGNTVKVTRRLKLNFPRAVCTPAEQASEHEAADRVHRDTAAQITYR